MRSHFLNSVDQGRKAQASPDQVSVKRHLGGVYLHQPGPEPAGESPRVSGGVAEQLQGSPFDKLALAHSYKVEEKANWKVVLDAQNEVYNFPFQHRYSFPDFFVLKDNRFTRLQAVKLYNHHSVYSCEINPDHKETPLEALLYRLDTATTTCRLPLIGDFDFYTIFPNFTVLFFRGAANDFCMTYNLWPLAVDRTVWEIRVYFPPTKNVGQRINQEYMKCQAARTTEVVTTNPEVHS